MQKYTHSIIEAATHAIIGFLIGFIIVLAIDLFGGYVGFEIDINWWQNLFISAIIVTCNTIKAYVIRRLFTRLGGKHEDKETT